MTIDYASVYGSAFFDAADGIAEWKARKLKCGDALAAIGYAFGLSSLDAVRACVPFEGDGNPAPDDGLDAAAQVARVVAAKSREPRGTLEIGAGRGEVSVSLAHLGYAVQAIEPSVDATSWFARTAEHFYGAESRVRLLNAPAHTVLDAVDWSTVDTVIMVESLEHVLAEDFAPVYERVVTELRRTRGRFIIVNWPSYHPIQVGWYAPPTVHCRVVDDALFDDWSKGAASVVFRQGSHLVLDY